MNALAMISNTNTGALRDLLRTAAQTYGKPAISGYTPREKTFPAIFFGFDDVIIMRASDSRNVIVRRCGKTGVEMFDAREFSADLAAMCAYAEQFVPRPPRAVDTPERDQYNAEWLDALARLDARQEDEHAAQDADYRAAFADAQCARYAGAW